MLIIKSQHQNQPDDFLRPPQYENLDDQLIRLFQIEYAIGEIKRRQHGNQRLQFNHRATKWLSNLQEQASELSQRAGADMLYHIEQWLAFHTGSGFAGEVSGIESGSPCYDEKGIVHLGGNFYYDNLRSDVQEAFLDMHPEFIQESTQQYMTDMHDQNEVAQEPDAETQRYMANEYLENYSFMELLDWMRQYYNDADVILEKAIYQNIYPAWRWHWGDQLEVAEKNVQGAYDRLNAALQSGQLNEILVAINTALNAQHVHGGMYERMDLSKDTMEALSNLNTDELDVFVDQITGPDWKNASQNKYTFKFAQAAQIMYGVYEDESFKDKSILQQIRSAVKEIGSRVEDRPTASGNEDDPKQWHIRYIQFDASKMQQIENIVQQGMWDEWYALFWDDKEVRVVFNNGTRTSPNIGKSSSPSFDENNLGDIFDIAKQNNIDEGYMREHLSDAMNNFTSTQSEVNTDASYSFSFNKFAKIEQPPSSHGDDYTRTIADSDRYTTDRYVLSISIRNVKDGHAVSFQITNSQLGISGYVHYWNYKEDEAAAAKKTYNELTKIADTLANQVEYDRVPMAVINAMGRSAVDKVDVPHKERSGVVHFNWYTTDVEKASDWRETIYGKRYPTPGLSAIHDNWNDGDKSSKITKENVGRNAVYRFKYAQQESQGWFDMQKEDVKNWIIKRWKNLGISIVGTAILSAALALSEANYDKFQQIEQQALAQQSQSERIIIPQPLSDQSLQEDIKLPEQAERPSQNADKPIPEKRKNNNDRFSTALNILLGNEGGYNDDPDDRGGKTNYGVTHKTYSAWLKKHKLPWADVSKITKDQVKSIYQDEYWNKIGGNNLPEQTAVQLFDFAVNSGAYRSVRYLQMILNAKVTGVFDHETNQKLQEYLTTNSDADLAREVLQNRTQYVAKSFKKGVIHKKYENGLRRRLKHMHNILEKQTKNQARRLAEKHGYHWGKIAKELNLHNAKPAHIAQVNKAFLSLSASI